MVMEIIAQLCDSDQTDSLSRLTSHSWATSVVSPYRRVPPVIISNWNINEYGSINA